MMIDLLNYIIWQPDLEAFRLGPIAVRWYGLMWIIGLALAYLVVQRLYKEQKIKDELFDPLFIYCFLGILIGARLGHCIFYEPDYFLTSGKGFVEMQSLGSLIEHFHLQTLADTLDGLNRDVLTHEVELTLLYKTIRLKPVGG